MDCVEMTEVEKKTFSMREAALQLGLGPNEFCDCVRRGAIKAFRVGYDWHVHEDSMIDCLQSLKLDGIQQAEKASEIAQAA